MFAFQDFVVDDNSTLIFVGGGGICCKCINDVDTIQLWTILQSEIINGLYIYIYVQCKDFIKHHSAIFIVIPMAEI